MENLIFFILIAVLIVCCLFTVGFIVLMLLNIRQLVNNWIESLEDPDHD